MTNKAFQASQFNKPKQYKDLSGTDINQPGDGTIAILQVKWFIWTTYRGFWLQQHRLSFKNTYDRVKLRNT